LLRDELATQVVIRATESFNLHCNNVARQVEEKCCPYYRTCTCKYGFSPDLGGKNGGVLSMRMQVILDSSFARPGSAPIWGGKKGEFRDWTNTHRETENCSIVQIERSRINMRRSSYSSSGENRQQIDENENAVRMQAELRLYGRAGLS